MMSDIYTNLPVNAIVRLPHPRNLGQETFLAPSTATRKPGTITKSAQTTIPPYQP